MATRSNKNASSSAAISGRASAGSEDLEKMAQFEEGGEDEDYDDDEEEFDENGDEEDDDNERDVEGDGRGKDKGKENSHEHHTSDHILKLWKKKYGHMSHKAEYLKVALLRRNDVIEELRRAYLKDVLALKTVLNNVLRDDTEREHVLSTYNAYIPCIDLTAPLPLHNPENAFFTLKPCEVCGGHMEVKILDADQVMKLRQQLTKTKREEEKLRIQSAEATYKFESLNRELKKFQDDHTMEKRVLFEQMQKLNYENAIFNDEHERLKKENAKLRNDMENMAKEHKKADVPTLRRELTQHQEIANDQGRVIITLKESLQAANIELANARKTISREHEKYSELLAQKQNVDKHLKVAEKDYEQAISSNQRLNDMNKDLQKSLMLVNEKCYNIERKYTQLEYETNSLKEKANDENEGMTTAMDALRKELHLTEKKLNQCLEALEVSKMEVDAMHEEIIARDKSIEELEVEIEDLQDSEDAMHEELMQLRQYARSVAEGDPINIDHLNLQPEADEELVESREASRSMRAERSLERAESHKAMATSRKALSSQKLELINRQNVPNPTNNAKKAPMARQSSAGMLNKTDSNSSNKISESSSVAFSRQPSSSTSTLTPIGSPNKLNQEEAVGASEGGAIVDADGNLIMREASSASSVGDGGDGDGIISRVTSDGSNAGAARQLTIDTAAVATAAAAAGGDSVGGGGGPPSTDSTHRKRGGSHVRHHGSHGHHRESPGRHGDSIAEDSNHLDGNADGSHSNSNSNSIGKAARTSTRLDSNQQQQAQAQAQAQAQQGNVASTGTSPANYKNRIKSRTSGKSNLVSGEVAAVAAEAKKKQRVVMPPQEEPEILLDLSKHATSAEVSIRAGLMSSIAEAVGMNSTKKVVNRSAHLMEQISQVITINERTVWNSLILMKNFTDMLHKLKTIFKSLSACKALGIVSQEVSQIISECEPLITMNGNSFSFEWFGEVQLPTEVTAMLTTTTGQNAIDGKVQSYELQLPSYYKGEINAKHVELVQSMHEMVLNLFKHSDSIMNETLASFHDLLEDYGEAKCLHVGLEDVLKKEGDRVRLIMAREMELMKKEMDKLKTQLNESLMENALMVKKLDDLNISLNELRDLPELVSRCKNEILDLTVERDEGRAHIEILNKHNQSMNSEVSTLEEKLMKTEIKYQASENAYNKERKDLIETRAKLADTQRELDDTSEALQVVLAREQARWAAGCHQHIQTDPIPARTVALQTEFVSPQFTVKTIMKRNERGIYPVITPDLTEQSRIMDTRHLAECRILDKLNKALEADVDRIKTNRISSYASEGDGRHSIGIETDMNDDLDDLDPEQQLHHHQQQLQNSSESSNNNNYNNANDDDDASGISEITFNSSMDQQQQQLQQQGHHPHHHSHHLHNAAGSIRSSIQSLSQQNKTSTSVLGSNYAEGSVVHDWEFLGSDASRTSESIKSIIQDVLTHTHEDNSVRDLSGHLSMYAVKKGVPIAIEQRKSKAKKLSKSDKGHYGSSDASVSSYTSNVSSSAGSNNHMNELSHSSNNSITSISSKVSGAGATSTASAAGLVAAHRAQSSVLTAEDFLSSVKPHQPPNKAAAIGGQRAGTANGTSKPNHNGDAASVGSYGSKSSRTEVTLPTVSKARVAGKHVTYSDQTPLRLNSMRNLDVSSDAVIDDSNLPAPPTTGPNAFGVRTVAGSNGPSSSFMPSFQSTSTQFSSPIHTTSKKASGYGTVTPSTPSTLLSAVGVNVISGSGYHGGNSAGSNMYPDRYVDDNGNSLIVNYTPAKSPYSDPKVRINGSNISDMKREFFGR